MLLGFLAVCSAVCARAQTAVDGAIRGNVYDSSGAGVVGASIRVTGVSPGARTGMQAGELRAVTGSEGEFVLGRVSPGEYEVWVEAAGFQRMAMGRVTVEVGGVAEVVGRLRVIGVGVAVSVGAEVEDEGLEDGVAAGLATVARSGGRGELERLPVSGRRWQSFALLGGVASEDTSGDGLLSFRGLPATQNSTMVDGVSNDQSFGAVPRGSGGEAVGTEDELEAGFSSAAGRGRAFGVGTGRRVGTAYTFSQEAVREFRTSVQNYSALYGHGAGGMIHTVSKGGTNVLHGAVFYLARDSAWAAANPFSVATSYTNGLVASGVVKPRDMRQQFGASVGGAAVRDRLFYFYTLDVQRRKDPAVSSPQDPEFYRLTPTQRALLGNRGVTATKVDAALNYLSSLTGTVSRRQDQDVNFGKLDWQPWSGHKFSLEYNRARMNAPAGARGGAVVDRARASLGSSHGSVDDLMGRWMWASSAHVNNEVRVHFGRELQFETTQAPLPQEPAIGPDGLTPQVSIGPQGLIFGTPASLGRRAYPNERRMGASELLTWARGRHLVQVGGEFDAVRDEVSALNNVEGTFNYDSGVTRGKAGGLVDWITDFTFNVHAYPNGACPSINATVHDFCFRSFTQSFGQQAVAFDTQEWAGFVEDSWRIGRNFSVKAGLRYEYELLPFPQQPNGALDATFGAVGATSVFPEDRNNLGLRLGIGWEPLGTGRGTVRVGYGQYFGRLAGATIRSALVDTARASSTMHVRIAPGTVTSCPQVANQGFGYECTYVTAPPAGVATTTSAMVFDRRFQLPAVQQGSFALERGFGRGVTLSATYLMNLDRQLADSVDINIAPSTGMKMFQVSGGTGMRGLRDGTTFQVPVYTQRVSTSYGPVTDIVSNANGSYNAMVLEARRRSRKGVEFRVAWTWAKAIDFGQSGGAVPRTNGQFDPFDVRYDKGLSSFNHSHRIAGSMVWEPRVAGVQRWLREVAGGWSVAPVFLEESGRPYSYDIFGGSRLSGGRESVNGAGGAVYLPTVGRNTLRLPDTVNLDVRVSRGVRVRDRVWVRGMVEVFNLGNRVNTSAVSERAFLVGDEVSGVTPLVFQDAAAVAAEGLNVRPFGVATAAGTDQARERQVQLGLRVEF
ncbi:carboxypeptidase-like regulatory domain-containing protein [Granulicella sp. dw_53]|uniref:carboxypeptidase-like regulatory domain-containing protein n=1 Tax=Granulicella sp. dw_53 TaxID=2719792 RepID=UPI0031F6F6E8